MKWLNTRFNTEKKLNQKGFGVLEIVAVLVLLVAVAAGGWLIYSRNKSPASNTNQTQTDTAQSEDKDSTDTETNNARPTYNSQAECEAATNSECRYAMCDYVPEGKTREEACGKNFREGWRATK